MSKPLVSVIVATYKRSDELKRAIASVIAQTYMNIELIIVDDNDNKEWNKKVAEIVCDEMTASTCPFKLIQNHPNQGSAKTRNIGINAANGEYICFLDDDDIYLPDRINNQVRDMINNNADYGITDLALYNEDDSVSEIRKRGYLESKEKDNLQLCHLKYHMTGTDSLMFKRDYLLSFGGFDPIDSGDEYYLMMKAITALGTLVYTPECDIKAYVHTGENGLSSGRGKIEGENNLYKYKRKYFKNIGLKDRNYITMRHFAVLSFAYLRMHKLINFAWYGFLSFVTAPIQCVQLLFERNKDS